MPQRKLSRLSDAYFGAVIVAGLGVTIHAATDVYASGLSRDWMILAALTLLSGSFTVKIPGLLARISVSDAFVFASVLLFGPSVATVIVAVDSLVATLWMLPEHRSLLRSLFNVSAVALAISIASHTFYFLAGAAPGEALVLSTLVAPLFALAALYFLINSWLVAVALGFEKQAGVAVLWWNNFPWFSLNYFAGVSVAALLISQTRQVDLTAISIIIPLLVISYLTHRTSLGRVEDAQRHVSQVNELYMSTIETLAMAVDAKDQITHGHIRRVQVYALELAKRLGVSDKRQLQAIETAALLHDMGKLAIPEHILNKPGKLTPAEFEKMKRHADIGADLLSSIRFPYPVVPIVRHHHEHWNGQGYPAGIAGTDIPLGARILSVVDCFDALDSDRPYRPRLSHEESFAILRERRGSMYDPLVVDTFISVYDEISPAAIRAGQEARSLVDALGNEVPRPATPLAAISANASEAALLTSCREAILSSRSVHEALTSAETQLRQLVPATVYALYRYDAGRDMLVCETAMGDHHRLMKGLSIKLGERISGWVGSTRRTAVNSDPLLDLSQIARQFDPQLRSSLVTPIEHGDRLLGVLACYSSRSEAFTDTHKYAAQDVAVALADLLNASAQSGSNVVMFRS